MFSRVRVNAAFTSPRGLFYPYFIMSKVAIDFTMSFIVFRLWLKLGSQHYILRYGINEFNAGLDSGSTLFFTIIIS